MRFILPLSLLVGCTMDSSLTGEQEILLTAITGQEEVFSSHDIAARGMQPITQMPELFRQCDAQASFEAIFAAYDANTNQELEATEEEQVCSDREERATHHKRRARHIMKLLEYVYDIDGDGILSEEERTPLYEDFNARCEVLHTQLLEEFDTDGDGTLSEEERQNAHDEAHNRHEEGDRHSDHDDGDHHEEGDDHEEHGKRGKHHQEDGLPPFARAYDIDGDETLNASELETFRSETREAIRTGEAFGKKCGEQED